MILPFYYWAFTDKGDKMSISFFLCVCMCVRTHVCVYVGGRGSVQVRAPMFMEVI